MDFLNAQSWKERLRGAVVALFLLGALVPGAHAQLGIVPSITVQPLDQTVKKGGTAVFSVEAFSLTTMSYQWYRNGVAIPGATDSTYIRANVDFPQAGSYYVVVANFIGGTQSDVVQLIVLSNAVPVGVNDTFSTLEDVPLTVPAGDILSNDTDADGDALTALLVTNVTRGTLTFGTNGGFIYRPNTNYNGSDSFAYRPRDPVATGSVAIVTINVVPQDDPPLAVNDSTNTLEDTSVTVNVLRNDSEVDGETLAITGTSVTNGTAVISGTNIVFTPSPNYNGVVNFSYTISDGISFATGSVAVTVMAVNDLPVGSNDSYTTVEDVPLTIVVPGVLANDTDADSDGLIVQLVGNVTYGTLNLNTNGSFTYVPGTNYSGRDSFSYRPLDSASALVRVLEENVVGDNKVEIKAGQKGAQSFRNGTIGQPIYAISKVVLYLSRETTLPNANLNFNIGTGINSGAIAGSSVVIPPSSITNTSSGNNFQTYEISFGTPVGPLTAGTTYYLNLECEASNGKRIWSDYNDQNGYTRGTYYKGGSDDAKDMLFQIIGSTNFLAIAPVTVTIDVTAVNDIPVANNDSTNTLEDTSVVINLLHNDSDVEGPITITDISITNGTATINGTNIVFIPASNFYGTVVLGYTISDGTNSSTANVTITVAAVNDPPVAQNDAYSTMEDTALTVPAAGVLANDVDVDSGVLTAVLVSSPTQGSLSLNANGSFSYTPNANFSGADSFTYRARDGLINGNLGTVTINVTPVNDVPVANNDNTNTLEDTSVTVRVLANDLDVEGPLTISSTSTTNGTAVISGNDIVFTPASNYFGAVVFSYVVSDGTNSATANVTVNVISVNDAPPLANNDVYAAVEDVPLAVAGTGVLANDTDVDGDPIITLLVTNASHGTVNLNANGSFTYTPNTNYNGSDSFSYRATDSMATGNVATVTINIAPVNDAPFAVNDTASTLEDSSVTVNVLANDSDVEGALLTLTGASTTDGTVLISGTDVVFTPAANFYGTTFLSYTISDGSITSTGRVTVTVIPVDDSPIAFNDTATTAEDTSVTINVLANDIEPDRTPLSIIGIATTNGSAVISGTNIVFTPANNFYGTVVFSYAASDGTSSAPATVTVTVTPVNDAPIGTNDTYTTRKNVPLIVPAPGILANDRDVEGDPFTAKGFATVIHGSLTLSNDGSFIYTPNAGYVGPDSFNYRPKDAGGNGNLTTVTIVVHEPPNAVNDSTSTLEDTSVIINVLANDSDPEGSPITLAGVFTTNGTAVINGTNLVFTPSTNFNGTVALSYTISDGTYSATGRVTVNVLPVGDAPVANSDRYSTPKNVALSIPAAGILANDADADGDALSAALVSSVNHGSLSLLPNGSFTYTPASDYLGSDAFTYCVHAGSATSAVTTVSITIVDPTPLRFVCTQPTTNGCELTLSGPSLSTYVIFASPDMTNWSPISTNYTASGSLVFTDIMSPKAERRFYRAMVANLSATQE